MKTISGIIAQLITISLCSCLLITNFGCSHRDPALSASPSTATDSDNHVNSESNEPNHVADLIMKTKNEELLHAAAEGQVDRVRALIADGANVNAIDNNGLPVLVVAIAFNQTEVIKILIDSGADVNIRYLQDKHTPLFAIALSGSDEALKDEPTALTIAQMLIAAKANVNISDSDGITPLEFVATMGYSTVAQALIAAGAKVNAQDRDGLTPLHIAALNNNLETREVLLKAGANINARSSKYTYRETPLLMAAYQLESESKVEDFSDGVILLLSSGANPNQVNSRGNSALMYASRSGYLKAVKSLLKAGANANAHDNRGSTVLHYAADCRANPIICEEIVQIILAEGVEVDVQDDDGDTALTVAAIRNHTSIETLLLYAGADPTIKNNNGFSAESIQKSRAAEANEK